MVRIVLGAAACALALTVACASGWADGSVKSLSDLNGGASNWQYIAPGGNAGKTQADPLTNVSSVQAQQAQSATSSRGVTQLDDNLAIEAAPPPPKKPAASLWFQQQGK